VRARKLVARRPAPARPQVLHARDRYLAPGGAVLPDTATIYVAGGNAQATGLPFWDDVYGFNMAPVKQHARHNTLHR
jgi:protein arginine N-methyltransferase 3